MLRHLLLIITIALVRAQFDQKRSLHSARPAVGGEDAGTHRSVAVAVDAPRIQFQLNSMSSGSDRARNDGDVAIAREDR